MRSCFILTGALVLLLGVTSVFAEDAKDGDAVDPVVWGEAVNGLQLGISPPVKVSDTNEIVGVDGPAFDDGSLQLMVHLRNVGKSPVRMLPSVWDCLAVGDGGAVTVSKLIMTPARGGNPLTVTYQGLNHLRPMDARDAESEQETPGKNDSGGAEIPLDLAAGKDLQIEIAKGDAVWPEYVKFTPGKESKSRWRLTEKSNRVPAGKYRITAVLIVDQKVSDWKGKLTSGMLEVELRGHTTN